ncbi:MAG: leucyl aminopeptidase family protein [Sphingobium sp.]|nr:leucyl aminopeptidase family protein [Sphingobium sp.]
MTDYADLLKAETGQPAHILHLITAEYLDTWLAGQPERVRTALSLQKFRGKAGSFAIIPGEKPEDWAAITGVTDTSKLDCWCIAKAAEMLPAGTYRLADNQAPGASALGWLLAQYRFDRYRHEKDDTPVTGPRILISPDVAQIEPAIRLARAVSRVRDLVNIPTSDMGPADLEASAADIARKYGATISVTSGDALEQGYPMIHAVGRAAARENAPRLIEITWGKADHPRIAIIGKGVCFDSGGLDLKPSSAMRLMKKDMGGAAHALALAELVIDSHLPVRLHLLIPAVENAVSGNAFRPGDVLKTRKGLSVEIGNTDAEGRLVLGDALTRAAEEKPELILDFATLTGAARVALGPDLPALFANDDALARQLVECGTAVDDPLWQLPLWSAYLDMLKSDIADIANAGDGGFAGSITAALFLKKFVTDDTQWAHFDTFAWRPSPKPGRPKGGEALGLRAAFALLQQRYGRG